MNARITRRVNLTNTRFHDIGATPYLQAAMTADAEYMKALVALGADPSLKNAEGSTALMTAAGLGTRSPGEDAGTEEEVIEAMQVALDHGDDINAVDKNGETAMHGAAYKNLPGAVKFLADKGAKIDVWNTPNKFGWTPLTIARGYRFGNFKPSAVTVAAIEKVMVSAGVVPPSEKEDQREGIRHLRPGEPAQAAALSAGSARPNNLSSSLDVQHDAGAVGHDADCRRWCGNGAVQLQSLIPGPQSLRESSTVGSRITYNSAPLLPQ